MSFKKNKKAQMKSWMIWLIMAGAFMIIFFVFYTPAMASGSKGFADMLKEGDFDGDNKENGYATDVMDPCPCGLENVKVRASSGKEYCVADFNDVVCGCADKLANDMAIQKYDFKEKEISPRFIYDEANTQKCLYTKDECVLLIAKNKDFFNELTARGIAGVTGCEATTTS
ncbi:MAG: hypothetical protein ACP5N2_06770 [Candidatus Nanoarchaeia archaeon]